MCPLSRLFKSTNPCHLSSYHHFGWFYQKNHHSQYPCISIQLKQSSSRPKGCFVQAVLQFPCISSVRLPTCDKLTSILSYMLPRSMLQNLRVLGSHYLLHWVNITKFTLFIFQVVPEIVQPWGIQVNILQSVKVQKMSSVLRPIMSKVALLGLRLAC